MKIKELIKELSECNPETNVTIVRGNEDDNDIDTGDFEVHHKYTDEYIELFIADDGFKRRNVEPSKTDKYTGYQLWEKIFNSDLEEAFLERNGLTKNFDDMGTEEEQKEIVELLDGKCVADIVDDYLQYHGHGLCANDLAYILIELLDLDLEDIKALGDC